MLIFTITYATIAIPLKSFSSMHNRRIGFISLLSIITIAITNFPLSYKSSYFLYEASSTTFSLYNDFMKATCINHVIDITILLLGAMLISPYLYYSPELSNVASKASRASRVHRIKEYSEYLFFCFCTILGGILLSASNDLLLFILSIELQSYSLYIIASTSLRIVPSVFKKDSQPSNITINTLSTTNEPSEAAGLKYYLLGALASSIILLGIGIIYATVGTTNFNSISIVLNGMLQPLGELPLVDMTTAAPLIEEVNELNQQGTLLSTITLFNTTYLGLLLILTGLIWKFAGAPLHNWAIDVYDAVPTVSASWLAIIPKIALLTSMSQIIYLWIFTLVSSATQNRLGALRSAENTNNSYISLGAEHSGVHLEEHLALETNGAMQGQPEQLHSVVESLVRSTSLGENLHMSTQLILFVSILSLIIGAIGALTQPLIKRVLAYSSIGQIGFILLGLGTADSQEGGNIGTSIFYLIQYSLTNTGLWLALLSSSLYIYSDTNKKSEFSYSIKNSNNSTPSFFLLSLVQNALWRKEVEKNFVEGTSPFLLSFFNKKKLGEIKKENDKNLTLTSSYQKDFLEEKSLNKYVNKINLKRPEESMIFEKQLKEVRSIKELQGLHKNNLFLALSFAILLFSTAGIPPMIGFFAKLEIISASLNSGYITLSFIAITSSLISATYYLIIIRNIWFYESVSASETLSSAPFISNRVNAAKSKISTNSRETTIRDNEKISNYNTMSFSLSFILSIITMIVMLYFFQGFVIWDWFTCFAGHL